MNELNGMKKDWRWEDFFSQIQDLIEYSDVKPAKPGEEPFIDETQKGSALDALGGYVSIAGDVTPEGLSFPVHLAQLERIENLLSGMLLKRVGSKILVPQYDLPGFLKLVPILGPVAEWLDDFV
jgi:hypothetical protein